MNGYQILNLGIYNISTNLKVLLLSSSCSLTILQITFEKKSLSLNIKKPISDTLWIKKKL